MIKDYLLRLLGKTTAELNAASLANGDFTYNTDTESFEIVGGDTARKQLNAPYEFENGDTATSIAGNGTQNLITNLDKKGYTKGYAHLLGLTGFGSFIKFSNDGKFATTEGCLYASSYDSSVIATQASSTWYDSARTYIRVQAITLDGDGDQVIVTFRNTYPSGAKTLYCQRIRGTVW